MGSLNDFFSELVLRSLEALYYTHVAALLLYVDLSQRTGTIVHEEVSQSLELHM